MDISVARRCPCRAGAKISVAAAGEADGRDRLEDNDKVGEKRPVLDVLRVESDARGVGDVVAAADLPEPRQAGTRTQIKHGGRIIEFEFVFDHRTGADDAHFTANDVEELRQLVEAELTQDCPDNGDTRIILKLACRTPFFIGVGIVPEKLFQDLVALFHHRTEFQALEELAVVTDSAMAIKDTAAVRELDEGHDEQKERAEEKEGHGGGKNVETAFCHAPDRSDCPGFLGDKKRRTGRASRGLHRGDSIYVGDCRSRGTRAHLT